MCAAFKNCLVAHLTAAVAQCGGGLADVPVTGPGKMSDKFVMEWLVGMRYAVD